MCLRQQTVRTYDIDSKRWVKIEHFPSSEHLNDRGPIPGVCHVCEHEGVSSSSRYVFVKKTIPDLLQIIHYMNPQIQEGGNDCGLFAIATATTLCHVEDPVD